MDSYWLFLLVAVLTIASPGPGVILTLTNSVRYGVSGAVSGILGIAFGTFIVAGISATSVAAVLATSAVAFSIMKLVGAAYLIYLGIKLWSAPATKLDISPAQLAGRQRRRFWEGVLLQLTNPKAVFFFMSIFPQFVDFSSDYVWRFVWLVMTYSALVVVIHLAYASLAGSTRSWLSSDKGGRIVNRIGGGTFIGFGFGLATSSK